MNNALLASLLSFRVCGFLQFFFVFKTLHARASGFEVWECCLCSASLFGSSTQQECGDPLIASNGMENISRCDKSSINKSRQTAELSALMDMKNNFAYLLVAHAISVLMLGKYKLISLYHMM